jgi:23S rRNA (cytosine1962-C5)-methyltransferase
VEFRTQAPDHPILWAADESYYLKFFIFHFGTKYALSHFIMAS